MLEVRSHNLRSFKDLGLEIFSKRHQHFTNAELHVLLRSQLSRPKAVCLHGFRSNGDALAAQMGTLVSLSAPVLRCFDGAQRASLKAAKVVQRTPLLGLDLKQQGAFSEMICEIQFCYNF